MPLETGWQWWNYGLVALGTLGVLYSVFPRNWVDNIFGETPNPENPFSAPIGVLPDFTLCQLRNYAEEIVTKKVEEEWNQHPGFEVLVEFVRLPEYLRSSLFKRKIRAWGRECKNGVFSSEGLVPISASYWKFNQINRELFALPLPSSEEFARLVCLGMADEIIRHSDSETVYKNIHFNKRQATRQIKLFFRDD